MQAGGGEAEGLLEPRLCPVFLSVLLISVSGSQTVVGSVCVFVCVCVCVWGGGVLQIVMMVLFLTR